MKNPLAPRLCTRLDRMAAAAEAQWLDVLRRQQAALAQCAPQQQLLTAYRARLSRSWQAGEIVSAGEAHRATLFAAASHDASAQITAAAVRAETQIEAARQALAGLRAQRRNLADAIRAARRAQSNISDKP